MEKKSAGIAILTDGRSISQHMKLKALGLSRFPSYISEEFGEGKPSSMGFEIIMRDIPAPQYLYVADNPAKDFVAPNRLGWLTIGLKAGPHNVHPQKLEGLPLEYLPSSWISSLSEML